MFRPEDPSDEGRLEWGTLAGTVKCLPSGYGLATTSELSPSEVSDIVVSALPEIEALESAEAEVNRAE